MVACSIDGHEWVALADSGRYSLSLGAAAEFLLVPSADGKSWLAGHIDAAGVKAVLAEGVSLDRAATIAESMAKQILGAPWRKQRATAAQRERCAQLKIEVPPGSTKGEVSDLLSARLAELKARKKSTHEKEEAECRT